MKRSLVILMIILGCLLIGMMIYLYRENQSGQENFDSLDEGVWAVSDKMLGRSWLSPANVEVVDGYLNIRMPANTLAGGELVKKEAVSYGRYESRMKLPLAPDHRQHRSYQSTALQLGKLGCPYLQSTGQRQLWHYQRVFYGAEK